MTKASLPEIRRAISNVPSADLPDLCLRMARFKKENKELLSYLLFEADDEPEFIKRIKSEIDEHFKELNKNTPYIAKKGIRKILAFTNQNIRYSGQKRTEVELLLYFCLKFKKEAPFRYNLAIKNILIRQLERIRKSITSLHEDLQFDFSEELKKLD